MLKIVADESAIRRYRHLFIRALRAEAADLVTVTLGHPGASEKAKVAWSERLGIWFFLRKIPGSRYWNGFGVCRPEAGSSLSITCEINFPLLGIDRRTAGAFAQDPTGRVFVVHRGRLGGGRKGIGKSLFETRYRGVWEAMEEDGDQTQVAVIAALNSPRLARQIALFVHKIARMKEEAAVRSTQAELGFDELCLREELIGETCHGPEGSLAAECDRGIIVRDLYDAVKVSGLRTGNDSLRDLVILDREGRTRAVFQILAGASLPDLHAAAMRLLLHGLDYAEPPLLVLAVPSTPDHAIRERLARLNIDVLLYQWDGDRAVFTDLGTTLSSIGSG